MKHSESCTSTTLASGLKHPLFAWDTISEESLVYQCFNEEVVYEQSPQMLLGKRIIGLGTVSNIKHYIRVGSKEILGFIWTSKI